MKKRIVAILLAVTLAFGPAQATYASELPMGQAETETVVTSTEESSTETDEQNSVVEGTEMPAETETTEVKEPSTEIETVQGVEELPAETEAEEMVIPSAEMELTETIEEETEETEETEEELNGEEALNDPLYKKYHSQDASDLKFAPNITPIHNSKFDKYDKVYGIDVSKYQGTIDWKAVKNSGIEYAMIRLGYRGIEKGTLQVDSSFATNMIGAHAAGIKIGVYFYTQALNTAEAEQEAQFVLNYLNQYKGYTTYPVVIDIESYTGSRLDKAGLSADAKTTICSAFCKKIRSAGYTAGIYSNSNYLQTQLKTETLAKYFYIWVANHMTQNNYMGTYNMWQYSDVGLVNGITGYVDLNVEYVKRELTVPQKFKQSGATSTSISLSWDSVKSADGYKVYRYNISGKLVQSFDATEPQATMKNLVEGTTYQCKVAAFYKNTDGTYTYGTPTSLINVYTAPGAIGNVSVKSRTDTAVTLAWYNEPGATDYQILRYNSKTRKYVEIGTTSNASYTVKGLSAGTKYFFKICGFIVLNGNQKALGTPSTAISVKTKPGKVVGLATTAVTDKTVTATWTVQSGADGYWVYCYDAKGKLISNKNSKQNTYQMTGLEAGNSYKVKVRAYILNSDSSKVWGPYSDAFTVKTKPARVTGVYESSATAEKAVIRWPAATGADGYKVAMYNESTQKYKVLGTTTKNFYTITSLTAGKIYKVKIAAYAKNGKRMDLGTYSTVYEAASRPNTVTGVKQTQQTTDSITVSWSRVAGVTGYRVYCYDTSGKLTKNAYVTGTTYTAENVASGKYVYKVRSYIKSKTYTAWGSYSEGVTVRTQLPKVTGIRESSAGTDRAIIRWNAVAGADGYRVAMYDSKTGRYKVLGTTTKATYALTKLTVGSQYTVKVAAYGKVGTKTIYGAYSAAYAAASKPDRISGFKQTTSTGDSISVAWTALRNVDGYRVYCYDSQGNYLYDYYVTENKMTVTGVASGRYIYKVRGYVETEDYTAWGDLSAGLTVSTK